MASSPITPVERPTGFRRSSSQFATVPQRSLTFHEQAALSKEDASADVLYSHPDVRIYQFKPPTDALATLDKTKKTLPDADYPIDAIEILPWRSRNEQLVAKGKLIIEKVQGSAHFLKAGFSFVHTIMRNSQCWCVDGESKFVLRVGNLRYARIEFPNVEVLDKARVETFKEVLAKIMRFEKTPCPFIRAIKVDLPEDAITPRRRGTWKRKENMTPTTPDAESSFKRRPTRTLSIKGMPPNSFPRRSMTSMDSERPSTASTPVAGRSGFPDVRTDSPVNYTSSDSERHDSEDDRPESGYHSEVESSDKEERTVPIVKSPLQNVLNMPSEDDKKAHTSTIASPRPTLSGGRRSSTVEDQVKLFEQFTATEELAQKVSPSLKASSSRDSDIEPSLRTTVNELSSTERPPQVETQHEDQASIEPSHLDEPIPIRDLTNSVSNVATEENPVPVPEETSLPIHMEASTNNDDSEQPVKEASRPQSPGSKRRKSTKPARQMTVDEFGGLEVETDDELYRRLKDETRRPVRPLEEALNEIGYDLGLSPRTLQPKGLIRPIHSVSNFNARVDTSHDEAAQLNDDTESIVSTDSFHTLLSEKEEDTSNAWPPEMSNSRPFQHRREISEMTARPTTTQHDAEQTDASDATINEGDDNFAPPGAFIETSELRQRLRHRRSLSPLPPSPILRKSSEPGKSPLSTLLVQKAANLAVVKPVEIVLLVVHILARIAGGATMNDLVSGELFRRPGGPRRTASGTFEPSTTAAFHGRQADTQVSDSDDIDDYGHRVAKRRGSSRQSKPKTMLEKDEHALSDGSVD